MRFPEPEAQTMEKLSTDGAPAAIGPYSQGVKTGGLVYTSGQVPLDPGTGQMATGTIEDLTTRALRNVAAILAAGGSSKERVVKVTVFLADMNDFAAMNAAYERFFGAHRPARSAVQVSRLPKDARIEIEAVA